MNNTKRKTLSYRLRLWFQRRRQAYVRFRHRSAGFFNGCGILLSVLTAIASVMCLVCLVIRLGYEHSAHDYILLRNMLRISQGVFIANVVFGYLTDFRRTLRAALPVKVIPDMAVLLTLLPWIYPHPIHPWIPWLEQFLYSNKFLYITLATYAIISLSYSIFRVVGKRTNPSMLLSGSFLIFIIIGTFLLLLPKSTVTDISFVDSLFVSTSAVCITGLTPVDVAATFTPLGLLILVILMQIGALGVMTFTSFFALFFSGSTSIYSQLMLKDMIYSKSMSTLVPTLLYIFAFTVTVELIGAVMLFLSIHDTLGLTFSNEIVFSLFHSVSAFCNAGFSCFPDGFSNPLLLDGNISVYWIMTLLIVAGSIGFPILVNFRDAFAYHLRRVWRRLRRKSISDIRLVHIYNMNTKIVLYTFTLLFVGGSLLFFFLEYNNSLAGMTITEKITQSVFNSATPRSAGFSSVSPAGFLNTTLLMVMFLMWVGGASQSTGGGIKVNTLAAIWLNLRSILRGEPRPHAYGRTVAIGSIRRANAVVTLSVLSYMIFSFLLLALEPDLPTRDLLFESCSALFTVGSSLGVTPMLSDSSEVLLCVAMFLGRVGLISLLAGMLRRSAQAKCQYPSDTIIIN